MKMKTKRRERSNKSLKNSCIKTDEREIRKKRGRREGKKSQGEEDKDEEGERTNKGVRSSRFKKDKRKKKEKEDNKAGKESQWEEEKMKQEEKQINVREAAA